MITSIDYKQLSAPQKAELIYAHARSELSDRLWRAALGSGDGAPRDGWSAGPADGLGLDALLTLLGSEKNGAAPLPQPSPDSRTAPHPDEAAPDHPSSGIQEGQSPEARVDTGADGLGPNARHLPALSSAAERTGIPASALAAIVHAEAAKSPDGSWKTYSRNPRSSAAGLGQFLSGTWEHMAEKSGTWLNEVARAKGWLGANGQVLGNARSALLSLRYDAAASINTTADYARQNLDGLRRAGVRIGESAEKIAQTAYLGHHLGLGDAIRFLRGGIEPARARMLLGAQIGASKAGQHIAQAGDATAAHRTWLVNYVSRNVRPDRFSA